MKFPELHLLTAAVALFLVSCAEYIEPSSPKGEEQPAPIPEGYVRLDLEGPSKLYTDGLSVKWENGDKVMVNGNACEVLYDEAKDSHYLLAEEASSYDAFYPADIMTQWKGVMIPAMQYYRQGSPDATAMPMTASGTVTSLRFVHIAGILHFRLRGSGEYASVNVRDNSGKPLCGYLSKDEEGMWTQWSQTLRYDNVTLNFKKADGSGLMSDGVVDLYIPLPPGEYTDGLTITISRKDGHAMTLASSTPRTIVAGELLHTPDITFAVPQNQVYEYHFDACTLGGDVVDGVNRGYKYPVASVTGYEISNDISAVGTAGTPVLSSNFSDLKTFDMPASYISSRNLQDFNLLFNMWEYHGYLAGGFANSKGQSRAIFRLPAMSAIPEGKVCKVRLSFRFAWHSAEYSANPLMIYPHFTGSGKILGYKIDGQEIDIPKDGQNERWATGDNVYMTSSTKAENHLNENMLIKTDEMNDFKWHDVEILLGACTSTTVVNMQSFATKRTDGSFFIDDIRAYIEDYDGIYENMLKPSLMISPSSVSGMRNLKTQAKALGMEYVDLYVSTAYLYNTLEGNTDLWLSTMSSYAEELKAAGIKVWSIHMPYACIQYDDHWYDFIVTDASLRSAAVEHMKQALAAVAPFGAAYYVVHPSIHGDISWNYSRSRLTSSMQKLVSFVSDQGLSGAIAIENIMHGTEDGTSGWPSDCLTFNPENLNQLCADCPGLKVCMDASHACVTSRDGLQWKSEDYARVLGSNIAVLHMHDSNGLNDLHLYPGYQGGPFCAEKGIVNWGALYKTLVEECGYAGPFTYEMSTYGIDCIASFSGVADNYYGYVLGEYKAQQ